MKIILKDKLQFDPEFIVGRFNIEISEGFNIGDFVVKEKLDGTGLYIDIGIWNGKEMKSNVFIKKNVREKILGAWQKTLQIQRPDYYHELFG